MDKWILKIIFKAASRGILESSSSGPNITLCLKMCCFEHSWNFLSFPWANFLLGGCHFLRLKQEPMQNLCRHNYSHGKTVEQMGLVYMGEVMP